MEPVTPLSCYQCYSNSLEPCAFEDLKECPRYAFFNRCSVKVRKMASGEMFVKRECATGPCHGYDGAYGEDVTLGEHCDMRNPEYECMACCRGDGCNYSGSADGLHITALIPSVIFLFILRCKLE
ncbi:hypothetical protein HDE_11759 [Halotydeus destructor]|nr:hypothetical protein HDE_11759 [Halotydeus destructor]